MAFRRSLHTASQSEKKVQNRVVSLPAPKKVNGNPSDGKKGLPPHDTWMVAGGRGRAPPRGGGQAMSAI